MKKTRWLLSLPYHLWLLFFVIFPLLLIFYQSLLTTDGHLTLSHYQTFLTNTVYLKLMIASLFYAFLITLFSLLIAYPMAYFLSFLVHKELWIMLIILPTWINLLLKIYAFMGILSGHGHLNHFLSFFGLGGGGLLYTVPAFLLVATYIELPFMILPIFNSLNESDLNLRRAGEDLGANRWQIFRYIIFPLSLAGVRSGVQAVFIPSLSLFMLTRLIAGNKVLTLGTAIEEHFLVTQNWGMGATIGIVLIIMMLFVMIITRSSHDKMG